MPLTVRIVAVTKQPELLMTLKTHLAHSSYVESVQNANSLFDAEVKMVRNGANVLLVDAEMPPAGPPHIAQLQAIKRRYQVAVVYTSIYDSYADVAYKAGIDDFVSKPARFTSTTALRFVADLCKHIDAFLLRIKPPAMRDVTKMVTPQNNQKIVAIASSTGGTNALEDLLKVLPADIPPTVVVQHMPSGFTKLFADRLDINYRQTVREAATGDLLMRGTMLLAPADRHMRLVRNHLGQLAVDCFVGTKIHGVMPAADVLFESVANVCKGSAVGVVLTGMGNDGARGLLHMKKAGAKTIGQDEATCVVYGMPRAAKNIGVIDFELPLDKIADMIMHLARQ